MQNVRTTNLQRVYVRNAGNANILEWIREHFSMEYFFTLTKFSSIMNFRLFLFSFAIYLVTCTRPQ